MLKNGSEICESTKELDVDNIISENEPTCVQSTEITLDKLTEIELFRKVTVSVKAILVYETVQLTPDKLKQNIIVADATGNAKLTIILGRRREQPESRSKLQANRLRRSYLAICKIFVQRGKLAAFGYSRHWASTNCRRRGECGWMRKKRTT